MSLGLAYLMVTTVFSFLRLHPVVLLPLGHSSGIGPTDEEILRAGECQNLPGLPHPRFTSVTDFFDEASKATEHGGLPVWSGELYLEAHRGTFTSQGRTKVLQRRAEWALMAAESAAALTTIRADTPSPQQADLWRKLLLRQSHDAITGTWPARGWRRDPDRGR